MRLKDITILCPQYSGASISGSVSFVPMESLRNDSIDLQTIDFAEGKGKYTFFADGDLLLAKVTPCFENGNIAVANGLKQGIGFGSSEIFVLRANKKAFNRYLFYYSQSSPFQDAACATMCGVGGLKRISPLFMRTYELALPSIIDQQKIVSYLDERTSAIDSQVSLLEQKAKKYEQLKKSLISRTVTRGLNKDARLKDSGIDWIGQIPEQWNPIRLKDIAFMYSGLTGKSGDDFRCDDEKRTKPFVPFTNILNNFIIDFNQFKTVVMSDNEVQNRVLENDLLFLMSSEDYESIGKASCVLGNPGEVYLNSFCRGLRFRSTKNVLPKFVCYQLMAEKYRDALRFEARGFTRINLKIDRLESMFVCLPPLSEQHAIADYLDKRTAEIDAAIANINQQIEKYKLLRRALINEVVTGQRNVN